MNNLVCIVGRIAQMIENLDNNSMELVVKVSRSFKNSDGIYEEDLIPCQLYEGICRNISDYCRIGDIVGIKGRIQVRDGKIEIIAEKVTFLASKREDKNETESN